MTRRDFELIAATLKAELDNAATYKGADTRLAAQDTVDRLVTRFAVRLAQTNDRFDVARFKRACGVEA